MKDRTPPFGSDAVFFSDGLQRPLTPRAARVASFGPSAARVALLGVLVACLMLAGSSTVAASEVEAEVISQVWDDWEEDVGPYTADNLALLDEALLDVGLMAETVTPPCVPFLALTAQMLAVERAYWFIPGYTQTHEHLHYYTVGAALRTTAATDKGPERASWYEAAQEACRGAS